MKNPPMPDGGARRFAPAGSRAFGAWSLEVQRRKRIAANAPAFTSDPAIDITDPEVGDTLEVSNGVIAPDEIYDYAYQWLRDAVAIEAATAKTYTAVLADADAVLTCRVTATSRQGFGSATATSAGTDPVAGGTPPTPPDAPTGLHATPGDKIVDLTWDDEAGVTWKVFQDGVQIASGLTDPTLQVTGLANGTSFAFTVKASDGAGDSDPSAFDSVMPFWAISGLNITTRSDTGFTFAWGSLTTPLPEKLHYQIKETAGSWGSPVAEADVPQNAESVDIGGLNPNVQYDMRVYAIDGANEGEKNDGLAAQFTLITTPGNFTATPRDEGVEFAWDAGGGAMTWRLFKNGTQVGSDLGDVTTIVPVAFGEDDADYTLRAMNSNGNVSATAGPLTANRITYPGHAAFVLAGAIFTPELDNYSKPYAALVDAIAAFSAAFPGTEVIVRVRSNLGPGSVAISEGIQLAGLSIIGHGAPPYTIEATMEPQADAEFILNLEGVALAAITWPEYDTGHMAGPTPIDAATITGNGSATIGAITARGNNGSNGTAGADGSNQTGGNGSNGGNGDPPGAGDPGQSADASGVDASGGQHGTPGRNITIDGITVTAMDLSGGNAGNSANGGNGATAVGGNGGNGGDATAASAQDGGAGGNGGSATANGGNGSSGADGGNGGTCTRMNGAIVTTFTSAGGSMASGGTGGSHGNATGGTHGVGGSGIEGGSAGADGTDGSATANDGSNNADGTAGTPGSLV